MKKYLALVLALVMALSLVACGNKTAEEPSGDGDATEAAGRVFWLNFKPEADGTLQKVAAMYTEKTGVPVTIQTAASGTYNETLTAAMDKEAPPTMFVVGNQAAVDTWGDYCYDLTGTPIAGELTTDAYNLYDADGKLCSIGYCYECYGIIVNEDLLAKAGYQLSDITNFETLKAVAEDIHSRAAELGIRFVLDPASELRGDGQYLPASSLITILGNLTENAFDALRSAPENAQKEVTVSIREGEHGMLLSVDDSGTGMAAPQLDRIFERGFSTKGEGRGTGLSLVKETVDAFGGTIRVESEPGIGSSFIITLSDAESRAQT